MHLMVKIFCIFVLLAVIRSAESFPQFSIPFVSWNKPTEENPRFTLNIRVQNPFSSPFGKNSNIRQYEKSRGNNEVFYENVKLVTVTPNYDNYANNYDKYTTIAQTTKSPSYSEIYKINHNINIPRNQERDHQNLDHETTTQASANQEKQVHNVNFNDGDNEITTDYDLTTESTTEYETTTMDDFDLYRSGVSGHVVASLLG